MIIQIEILDCGIVIAMLRINCPVCSTETKDQFYHDKFRSYYFCHYCELIFVPSQYFLSETEEKSRYDLHENNLNDPGYRKFLSRMLNPMKDRIKIADKGLDFGSGPTPVLAAMFTELGYEIDIYDHFYANNPSALTKEYDFIVCTEVVEHLHSPKATLDIVWAQLKPGGTVGIMTKISTGMDRFPTWHYKNDETHVSFFSKKTFECLANFWNAELEFIKNDVILFKKS